MRPEARGEPGVQLREEICPAGGGAVYGGGGEGEVKVFGGRGQDCYKKKDGLECLTAFWPSFGGGDRRIRTDDPLLAKQML